MDRLKEILNNSKPNQNNISKQTNDDVQNIKLSPKKPGRKPNLTHVSEIDEEAKINKIARPIISKRFKKKDFKKAKLLSLGYPRDLVKENQKIGKGIKGKKRYIIPVRYQDEKGLTHNRNVQFGNVEHNDYLHTGDELKKIKCISRLKHEDNFLHENFYRLYLLNNTKDLTESFVMLKDALNV